MIKSGMHGPTDISPVGMAAALHLGLAIHNFGIQEFMPHPGYQPGLGVGIDLAAAAKFPYEAAYLPVNRLPDGTVHDW